MTYLPIIKCTNNQVCQDHCIPGSFGTVEIEERAQVESDWREKGKWKKRDIVLIDDFSPALGNYPVFKLSDVPARNCRRDNERIAESQKRLLLF